MRPLLLAWLFILVFSNIASAQKPDTSGWMLSDIHASIKDSIKIPGGSKSDANGMRTARTGAIVEIRATFSYFQTRQSVSTIGISSIRLTGVPNNGGKPWTVESIALGFDSNQGCRYLDPKVKGTDSQTLGGASVQLNVANERLSITSQPLPLCIAFESAEASRQMNLQFANTVVAMEISGAGLLKPLSQAVSVEESAMATHLIGRPVLPCSPLARTARIDGTVEVSLLISTAGNVVDAQIVSDTNALLRAGTVEAIRDWQYQPFQINGVSLNVNTRVRLQFRCMP